MFRFLRLISFFSALFICSATAEESAQDSNSLNWEQLSAEMDALISWSADPLSDLALEAKRSPIFFHSASIRAGSGHSDNYLKRYTPTPQDFATLEGDFYGNLLLPRSALTLILFGELTQYEDDSTTDTESLAFGLLEWSVPATWGTWGLRSSFFYGDQIYDASLSIQSPPLGSTFRQFRPEAAIFAKHILSAHDSLETSLSIRDTQFDDPDNDYYRAELKVKLGHQFDNDLTIATTFKGFAEQHSTASRSANGASLNPQRALFIEGATIRQELKGSAFKKTLDWSLEVGAELEIDRYGTYEDLYRSWSGIDLEWRWKRLMLRGMARIQQNKYDKRQLAYLDQTPLLQQFRSVEIEAKFDLARGFALVGNLEWNETTSRIQTDSYSEQRATLQFSWSY